VADQRDLANEAALAAMARHALHDEELVAGYAANGLESEAEIAQARVLVDRCTVCRDLHRDIAAIGSALAVEGTFTTKAPRDFRLTVEDAHLLGGRVVTRGFLASLRRSLAGLARPIGGTMATFGLIGLLVGSAALSGGGATGALSGAAPTSAPAELQAGGTQPGPKSSTTDTAFGPMATVESTRAGAGGDRDLTAVRGTNPALWLLGGSVALLLVGIGLLLVARRRARGTDDSS
jgi:hypothetical protein